MRRRLIEHRAPKLIMLREAGRSYDHVIRRPGYKYVDMLIVAGGGNGGDDSGGGGASGGILYVKDFITSKLNVGETVRFVIPYNTSNAEIHIKNQSIIVPAGESGYPGSSVGRPGEGGSSATIDLYGAYSILSKYLRDPELGVAIIYAGNGGGAGAGLVLNAYPQRGGSGASTSADGLNTGEAVENKDGLGGYTGGAGSGDRNPGKGITWAKVPIPIKSIFGSTAFSGKALPQLSLTSSGGGGAAGFGSGGDSGNGMGIPNSGAWGGGGGGGGTNQPGREGGNGITLLYYHN